VSSAKDRDVGTALRESHLGSRWPPRNERPSLVSQPIAKRPIRSMYEIRLHVTYSKEPSTMCIVMKPGPSMNLGVRQCADVHD